MTTPAAIVTATDLTTYQSGDPDTLLAQATAEVRKVCGWHVAPSMSDSFTIRGPWSTLVLPSLHVTDVASVTVDGTALDPAAGYVWTPDGLIRRAGCWVGSSSVTVVEFTHGYELDEVPDLAGVILGRVTRMQANPTGAVSVTTGPFSEQYQTDPDTAATIDRYRLPALP